MDLTNNITLEDIVDVLSNIKLSDEDKSKWIHINKVTTEDLIDAVNHVTIERNFYKRRCGLIKSETTINYRLKVKGKRCELTDDELMQRINDNDK